MSTPWAEYAELSEAEWEHLARLGGVDPHWLRLKRLVSGLLIGGQDNSQPNAVPRHVKSAATTLLVNLSTWLNAEASPRPQLTLVKSEVDEQPSMSPYVEAAQWIEAHPGTGSANSFAKLLLSLWNASNAFSIRECIDNLDGTRLQLALRVVNHFAEHGENRELIDIGYKVCETYPRLYELGQRAWDAKRELLETWRTAEQGRDEHE